MLPEKFVMVKFPYEGLTRKRGRRKIGGERERGEGGREKGEGRRGRGKGRRRGKGE